MTKKRATSGARAASLKKRPGRSKKGKPRVRVGIDTGGTFTDLVAIGPGLRIAFKVPSTPSQPEQAVVAALDELLRRVPSLRDTALAIVHGSTVATNTLLEGKGARVALVTNEGFEEVIEIADIGGVAFLDRNHQVESSDGYRFPE